MADPSVRDSSERVVGRLAPSPTGALHLGNARTFLLAWLSIRKQGGALILRMEDIDSPRVKPWARQATLQDLRWLGLDWDYGPDVGGPHQPYTQTERAEVYLQILNDLVTRDWVYPCICSRSEIALCASAPHESADGPIYPGTCRHRSSRDAQTLGTDQFAWRWRTDDRPIRVHDQVHGIIDRSVARELGDFVVARSNGWPAYQLAVVVDDFLMQVTEVVRGDDLLSSTFRQADLLRRMDWPQPSYAHVPLIVGPDGRRLAKRHGDTRLTYFRERKISNLAMVGYLAWTCGLLESPQPIRPNDLLAALDWNRLTKSPTIFDLQRDFSVLESISR